MNNLSVITPVYNEEKLLPRFIESVSLITDDIVFVDGSPFGVSSDNSAEIIQDYGYTYLSGTYGRAGIWDKDQQINEGIRNSKKDNLLILSVDSHVILDDYEFGYAWYEIEFGELITYYEYRQFWIDTHNLRHENGNVATLGMILNKQLNPKYIDHKLTYRGEILPEECKLARMTVYHCGWIRPFADQVQKHIRNVEVGGWGERGQKLLQRGDRALESWAIHHVLNYKQSSYIPCSKIVDFEMSYMDGISEFISQYEQKYKEEFYVGLTRTVPHDLI